MRLIDADELKEDLNQKVLDNCIYGQNVKALVQSLMDRSIDNLPTVEPVKHGEWISYRKPNRLWDIIVFKCSICGCENYHDSLYCPYCGAKMGGDKE